MPTEQAGALPRDQWVLIRRATQLLTLHGPSGPRRGAAMSEPGVVPDGAVLIRNGVIENVGPTSRVESLAGARHAWVIDAGGKVVMPAFIDPDILLGQHGPATISRLSRLSRRVVEAHAHTNADELARVGILTAGATTRHADDHANCIKLLQVHKAVNARLLRVRSIYSPAWLEQLTQENTPKLRRALAGIHRRSLASIMEVTLDDRGREQARAVSRTVAAAALAVRLRVISSPDAEDFRLAAFAGAVAMVAPLADTSVAARAMADIGCVHVIPVANPYDGGCAVATTRRSLDDGAAIALPEGEDGIFYARQGLGMTAAEAITAVTYNAAASLRLAHTTGSLQPGKTADLIMLDVPDYRELGELRGQRSVSLVMRAGRTVWQRGQ